jgi:predicted amidophosphoribosyltransferase
MDNATLQTPSSDPNTIALQQDIAKHPCSFCAANDPRPHGACWSCGRRLVFGHALCRGCSR